jgi:hypothetical protein
VRCFFYTVYWYQHCGGPKLQERTTVKKENLHLEGGRYGKVLVTDKAVKSRYWRCLCECGTVFEARGSRLKAGEITHCGCQKVKHGHTAGGTPSPTYQSWKAMKARCGNPNIPSHADVGYDPRWETFETFLTDMGLRSEGRHLNRKEPWEGYSKSNCAWDTDREAADDKRKTQTLFYRREAQGSPAMWSRWLISFTGNPKWTVPKLWATLKVFTLDQIVAAVHPWGLEPHDLRIAPDRKEPRILNPYLKLRLLVE